MALISLIYADVLLRKYSRNLLSKFGRFTMFRFLVNGCASGP